MGKNGRCSYPGQYGCFLDWWSRDGIGNAGRTSSIMGSED